MKQKQTPKFVHPPGKAAKFCFFMLVAILFYPPGLAAQSTGGYSISNNGATGVNAQKTEMLDFTNFNNTTAETTAGQSFVFTLANGFKLSLTAKNVGATYLGAVACPTITSSPETPLGYSAYTGLSGKPALYMNNNYNVDIFFSNIALTDAAGNSISNFTMALFDAERTGITGLTEYITGITNGGNWAAYESMGTGTFPTQTGIGTTSVTWTGNSTSVPTAAYAASTTTPTQLEVKMYGYEGFALGVYVPTGYIYTHLKHISEENSPTASTPPDYAFVLRDASGGTLNTFGLNDQADYSNDGLIANSGNIYYAYDIGLSHGPGGDGQLWAVAGTSFALLTSNPTTVTGKLYVRNVSSATWSQPTSSGSAITAAYVDGAYANQCVYSNTSGVFFYNNGTVTTLYSGTGATDVTCNNGYIAAVINEKVYVYNSNYTPSSAPAASGSGGYFGSSSSSLSSPILSPGAYVRIDMNINSTLIGIATPGSNTVNTLSLTGTETSLGTIGTKYSSYCDIAYDDLGTLYSVAYEGNTVAAYGSAPDCDLIFDYNGSTWTVEAPTRDLETLTGGAGHLVYAVNMLGGTNYDESIFSRQTDNSGNIYYIDDERIKTGSSLNGNGIVIPVAPGTYTVTETLPNSTTYDLGRYNIYDPGGATTGSVNSQVVTYVVTANEVVFAEYINEALVPKAIALNCTTQYLQTFDASTSSPVYTYTYGSNTYGNNIEGTAYHYYNGNVAGNAEANDGYYCLTKQLSSSTWFVSTANLTDHTGNSGYFLVVNASYAKDEFYRQRVTNLIPGLQYTISFYAANITPSNPIQPNFTYGLQDTLGNIVNSTTTGSFTTDAWTLFSFTFTATTSRADLFIDNNAIGGNGNDIALDDISINPVTISLGANTVSPAIAPNICLGTNYTFSNTQSGGIWSVSPTTVAKINAKTGKATGITSGDAIVTYTYTNAIGCVSTATTGIIVSTAPAIVVTDQLGTGTLCKSQTDSLYSSATGGTLPFTYAWSASPASGAGLSSTNTQNTSINVSTANTYTYTVLVSDAVGCSGTGSIPLTVSNNTAPTVTTTGPNTCLGSAITSLQATATGTGPFTYSWSGSPSATAGLSSANNTLQSPNPTPTAAGSYTYNVTVGNGSCTVKATPQTLTVYASPSVTVAGPSGPNSLCSGGSVALTSTVTAGSSTAYTYTWAGSYVSGPDASGSAGLQAPTNAASLTAKPTVTSSTSSTNYDTYKYVLTVTDGNGCAASANASAEVYLGAGNPPTVSISSPASATTLCSGSTVTLTASAAAGSSATISGYSWAGPGSYTSTTLSPGAITPTASGSYTLTVTETNGCKASATTPTITVNARPTVTASNYATDICYNTVDSVYSHASGGTSPYTYQWTVAGTSPVMTIATPTKDTSSVSGGNFGSAYTYTVTAKDANGCTATSTTSITSVSGNSVATGPSISNMPAAAIDCINSAKTLSPTVTQGYNTIATYLWTGTPTGNGLGATSTASTTITPTASGSYSYTLKVTDILGCAASATTGIQTVNSAIAVNVASQAPGFCGASGSLGLFASATGGSGTYSNYAWATTVVTGPGSTTVSPASSTSSGSTTASISGATIGTSTFKYTATITDNNGCSGSASSSILVTGSTPAVGSVTASANSTCAGGATVITLGATYSGGTSPYDYTWTAPSNSTVTPAYGDSSTSPVSATATATAAQNYTWGFAVVDANNCTATGLTSTVTLNTGLTIAAAANITTVCSGNPVSLTSATTGGTGTYTYLWSGSGTITTTTMQNPTADPTATGAYTVKVTDGAGCIGTGTTASVTVNSNPAISLSSNKSVVCASPATTINLTGTLNTATTAPYAYAWTGSGVVNNTGSITTIATPTTPGIYTVTVTDANGCTGAGTTSTIAYDMANPNISLSCGTNSNGVSYGQFYESNGVSWLWTTTSGGKFYTSSALNPTTASVVSSLQAPYVFYQGPYKVQITDANGCSGSGSYTIGALSCSVILAITGLDFTAQKEGSEALLDWSTESEINNNHFDVERSGDGVNWSSIGVVTAKGNSTTTTQYSFTDVLPLNGLNYYRLKQVNDDGSYNYSHIKTLEFTGQWLVKMYPNPAVSFVILQFNNDYNEKAAVVIQNTLGNNVFSTEQQLVKGLNIITLNQIQMLAQGTYLVTMVTNEHLYRSKFIKGAN